MSREDFVSYSCFDAQAVARYGEIWGGLARYREIEGDFMCPTCFDAQGTWLLWQQLRKHLEGMEWQQGQDRSASTTRTPTLTPP